MERSEVLSDMKAAFEAGKSKAGSGTSAEKAFQGSLDWITGEMAQPPEPEPGTPETAIAADSFVRRCSVQTHLNWRSTVWGENPAWRDLFVELGARYTRSQMGTSGPAYDDLLYIGAKAIIVVDNEEGGNFDTAGAQKALDKAAAHADAIEAIEGPNEANDGHLSDWANKVRDFQQWLFDAVNAMPELAQKKVIAPSIWKRTQADYAELGPVACDVGNLHYYTGGMPPPTTAQGDDSAMSSNLDEALADAQTIAPGKNIWITETGWPVSGPGCEPAPGFVTPLAQAKYLVRMLCDAYVRNVYKSNLYTLIDDSRNPPRYHGILDANLAKRPAFDALKRTLALFADPGDDFQLGELAMAAHLPEKVARLPLMQKRDGVFLLGLWQPDAMSYDRNTYKDAVIPPEEVTIDFGQSVAMRIWNPTTDEAPTWEASGASFMLEIPDHLTVLEITV